MGRDEGPFPAMVARLDFRMSNRYVHAARQGEEEAGRGDGLSAGGEVDGVDSGLRDSPSQ